MNYHTLKRLVEDYVDQWDVGELAAPLSRSLVYDFVSLLDGIRTTILVAVRTNVSGFDLVLKHVNSVRSDIAFIPCNIYEDGNGMWMFVTTRDNLTHCMQLSLVFNSAMIGVSDRCEEIGKLLGYPCPITDDEFEACEHAEFFSVVDSVCPAYAFRCSKACSKDHTEHIELYARKMQKHAQDLYGEDLQVRSRHTYS